MSHAGDAPVRLVVVGGGFTGTVLVIHLARLGVGPLDVVVVEPSAELGRGIAYGTRDPACRINVPSDRMGLSEADPEEATRWFFDHGVLPDEESGDDQGHFYVPRFAYGSFMGEQLRRAIDEAGERLTFRHRRAAATGLVRAGDVWRIGLDDGTTLEADAVALCFGHAVPQRPCVIEAEAASDPKFVPDPWAADAVAAIDARDSVLVVGTGLTMADVVVGLRHRGHRGPITAISRRGLLSRPHGLFLSDIDFLDGQPPPVTALALLRLFRERVRRDAAAIGWQPIADALRAKLPLIWRALPSSEKARVLRRLLPFWDVHRFRIAPQVDDALVRDRDTGGLQVERAGLAGLGRAGGRLVARLAYPSGERVARTFDAVVLCTGPERDLRRNPMVASLLDGGLAHLDETGLGLAVDGDSHVLDAAGDPWGSFFAFGPMTRGSFGEMTGAPDITKHIERVVRAWRE